jgi:hypothetical protein
VLGVIAGFSNILSAGGSTLVPGHWRALSLVSFYITSQSSLAQGVPPGVPESYRALADYGNVPRSTLHHRARGRPSIDAKAQGQQYLEPCEEDVVVKVFVANKDGPKRRFWLQDKGCLDRIHGRRNKGLDY